MLKNGMSKHTSAAVSLASVAAVFAATAVQAHEMQMPAGPHAVLPIASEVTHQVECPAGATARIELSWTPTDSVQVTSIRLGQLQNGAWPTQLNSALHGLMQFRYASFECAGSGISASFFGSRASADGNVVPASVILNWAGSGTTAISVRSVQSAQ